MLWQSASVCDFFHIVCYYRLERKAICRAGEVSRSHPQRTSSLPFFIGRQRPIASAGD